MADIVFYRQKRADGRIRTGLEVDGRTVGESLQGGDINHDPALVWYIDVELNSIDVAVDSEDAAQGWLLEHREAIARALNETAEELEVGTDVDVWPVRRQKPLSSGEDAVITVSAVRRLPLGELSSAIREWAGQFADAVRSLGNPEAVEW